MLDPVIQKLLEQAVDTPVKLHLVLVFHENPRLETTASALADRICRDIWSVSEALHELAEDGLMLCATILHGEPLYRYAPRPELIEPIGRLIRGYDDPIERDTLQRSIRALAAYAPYRRVQASPVQPA